MVNNSEVINKMNEILSKLYELEGKLIYAYICYNEVLRISFYNPDIMIDEGSNL